MRRIITVLALICLLAGCQISPRRGTISGGGGGGGGTGGQLYISTASSILHFNQAETSNGNVAPVGTINGASTQLSAPQQLLLDAPNDRLYVANQGGGSVLVFDSASTATGNATPTRVIFGNATHLTAPIAIALDPGNNLLYVADGTSILVFSGASTVAGNTPPVRNINTGASIGGLFLDAPNNQLYFSDPADNIVNRLDNASAQDVLPSVAASITGANTGLSQPRGLALDSSGRLLVSNSASPVSITVYANAATLGGPVNVTPSVTISGNNTLLRAPGQIALNRNVGTGELYVLDPLAASVLVFTNAPTTGGNVAPARNINGANTGITASAVNGLALDSTR